MPNKQIQTRVSDEEMPLGKACLELIKTLDSDIKTFLLQHFETEEKINEFLTSSVQSQVKTYITKLSKPNKVVDRVNAVLDTLMDWNNNSITDDKKIHIGNGVLQKLAGANNNTCKEVLESRMAEVKAHQDKHGLFQGGKNSAELLTTFKKELISREIIEEK